MKICRECKQEKPLSDFYVHTRMKDGYLNKCVECVKSRVKKHRVDNLDKIRAYDKERSMQPHRVEARKQYIKTDAGKIAKQKAQTNYKQRYPMIYAAHVITRNALRDGKIFREDICSVCGSDYKVEGHHDDYTKPLELRWLCEPCHKKWHRHNTPVYE